MWTIEKMKTIKKNIVNNFHLLTENQRSPNMLGQRLYNMFGQRLYNMLGQRLYNMLGQRWYNMLGQRFLDEQSADGFASRNQRWPNKNCSLRPNVGPTSTCYLGMSARRRAQFVPIGMPIICWKTFPAKTTKMLSTRNSSILIMSSSVYLFFESECSFTK